MAELTIGEPVRLQIVVVRVEPSQRLPLCSERAQLFLHARDATDSLRFGSREHVSLELARDLTMD
jgi:hypothetical protein